MSSSKHANSTLSAATLPTLLGSVADFAREAGLIKRRSRKFSAEGLLMTLFHAVCSGNASFQLLAARLSEFQKMSLTRQSLHQRFHSATVRFLQLVLSHVLDQRGVAVPGKTWFKRLLVQDSSHFRMHRKNAGHYRSVANNSGDMSGAKVDLVLDLVSGDTIGISEVEGYTQDRTLGPVLLEEVRPGDLVIRDLGYFDLPSFQQVEEKGAHWISRLHGTVTVVLADGKKLEKFLKSTRENRLDIEVEAGALRHSARLVAVRLPEHVANERRRKKKDKRKRNKTNPRKGSLVREGWNLYLTNLSSEECPADELVRFYEQRWQIEIQFRAVKQSTQMVRAMNRITNKHHLQCLLYAAMIFAVLSVRIHREIAAKLDHAHRLSIEKTARWLSQSIVFLRNLGEPLRYDLRHLLYDKRKRKTLKALKSTLLSLN